ncbi:hypothetical protein [Mesorhizobium sp. WSM4313]|uniref:hypothetical protein n=1 Tax=Mesorhizobium sp. WSM4313 TaxID=2029412 RepID=UPI000BAF4B5A|nr:hypothetical protein [Mesorhizobium sp. WSM4313]PBB16813.1 hypothetical protein CK219_26865 [Mesorhizobium sp. WSM4313]
MVELGAILPASKIDVVASIAADLTLSIAKAGRRRCSKTIHYLLGIELIDSCIDNRVEAGPFGPLADLWPAAVCAQG